MTISFVGAVTRYCDNSAGKAEWGDVNRSNCRTPRVIILLDEVIVRYVIVIHLMAPLTELN